MGCNRRLVSGGQGHVHKPGIWWMKPVSYQYRQLRLRAARFGPSEIQRAIPWAGENSDKTRIRQDILTRKSLQE